MRMFELEIISGTIIKVRGRFYQLRKPITIFVDGSILEKGDVMEAEDDCPDDRS